MDYIYDYESPVGTLTLSSDGENLTGIWIVGQKYYARTLGSERVVKELPIFEKTVQWLNIYFKGSDPGFTPPLAPKGSVFRQQVWKILLEIPFGDVLTYGEIAKKLAQKRGLETMSAQAVGGSVGYNPISIIIPCHRVVGSSGSLTGYAGGVETKFKLLSLEKADISKFYIPTKGTAL